MVDPLKVLWVLTNSTYLVSKFLKTGTSDLEDAPFFEKSLYKVEVKEDEELHKPIITIAAENNEDGSNVIYQITGGNVGGTFSVDPETGDISLAKNLDYESKKNYELRITVSDETGAVSSTSLQVDVLDTNDNPPVFQKPSYITTVTEEDAENLPRKILQVNVTDADVDRPQNIVYFLSGPGVDADEPSSSKFSINKNTGEIFVLKPLDRDLPVGRPLWRFTVFAQDEGGEGLVGYADVQVVLKDINDNPPAFLQSVQSANVTENSTTGVVVLTMTALDQDDPLEGGNAQLTYNIEKNVLDEQTGTPIFSIEPRSGLVRTNICCLDREKTPDYTLQIVAMDGGGLKGTGTVSILVTDINDMPPAFTKDEWMTEVPETLDDNLPDHAILTVNVIDPDESNDFYYRVVEGSGSGTDRFAMVRNPDGTGSLKVTKPLDYEDSQQREGFRFKIQVNDQGPNSTDDKHHVAYSWVVVRLRDVNDNSPHFEKTSSTVSLQEDVVVGTVVETFKAQDPDQGGQGRVTYSIDRSSDRGRHFHVNDQGTVTVQRSLDRETTPLHRVVITAADEGDPARTSSATLTVNVLDVNDNAPIFQQDYRPVLQENSPPRIVLEVYGKDADDFAKGNGPPYTFTLDPAVEDTIGKLFSVETNPKGDMDRGVAVISSLMTLDREEQKEYHIPILILDSGEPVMTGTSVLTVVVGDINDNKMAPGTTKIVVYKLEGIKEEVPFGRVYVEDADDWDLPDKMFVWETPPPPLARIRLDRDSGSLLLSEDSPLGTFHMQVRVRDSRHGPGSVVSDVSVTVKSISQKDLDNSGVLTLSGITDWEFIKNSNSSTSRMDMFREVVAQLLPTVPDNVHVFSVQSRSEFPPQTDVRFFVKEDSLYFKPVRLHAVLMMHREVVEGALRVNLSAVGFSGCSSETSCGTEVGCSEVLTFSPTPLTVDGNTTQLAGPSIMAKGVECVCGLQDFQRPEDCLSSPCLNGGTCLHTRLGPRCTCPEYHEGPRCQQTSRGFRGAGWAWYDPLQVCTISHLSLEILTSKSEGLVLYNGPIGPPRSTSPLFSDFISIEVVEGRALVLLDLGSGTVNLTTSTIVDDGEWHRIDVLWDSEEVRLVVDLCQTRNFSDLDHSTSRTCLDISALPLASSQLNVNTPLQLGGLFRDHFDPQKYRWTQSPRGIPLDGCIRNVMFNGHIVDLASPAMTEGSSSGCPHTQAACQASCSPWGICDASFSAVRCTCSPGYAGPGCSTATVPSSFLQDSYIKYSLSFEPDPYSTYLQLRFRTRQPQGELFRLMDQNQRAYFVLEIIDSRIQVRMNLNGLRPKEEFLMLVHVDVSDGQWHFVKVTRHGSSLILQLDGGEGRQYNESIRFVGPQDFFVDKQEGVFAGGTLGQVGLRLNHVATSFSQGCMDDIRLDGHALPLPPTLNGSQWGQAHVSNGVERYCISRNVCADVKCPGNLFCQDLWNKYVCSCENYQTPGLDGRCESKDECTNNPCTNGGVCEPLPPHHGPGPGYRCVCPEGLWGTRCELSPERQSLRLGLGALLAIVSCLLLILVVVALFMAYNRRREPPAMKKPSHDDDVRENIISYNDEGGGEDDLNAFDLLPLKVPVKGPESESKSRLQVPELIEETSFEGRIEGRRRRADLGHTAPPYDDLRNYAFEGSCDSVVGSLSSLESCADAEENVRFVVLGPRFARLLDIYSTVPHETQLEATV